MTLDAIRRPPVRSLEQWNRQRILDQLGQQGRSLPCSVAAVVSSGIVTVNFSVSGVTLPQVTVPVAMSRYVRLPLAVGDTGVVAAADARLGGVTGLGSGAAPQIQPANLQGLYFLPLGNTAWVEYLLTAVVCTAPDGVILRTDNGDALLTLNQSEIALAFGSNGVVVNGSGVSITGPLTINGTPYLTHEHSGVQSGSSNTGGVT